MKNIIKPLESEEKFYELIQEEKVHVFVFSANWCPDCVFIKPFMPELMNKYNSYEFVYVDRDQYLDLCIDHEVMGIPSFIAYQNNEEKGRFVSKLRKTKQEIDAFLGGDIMKKLVRTYVNNQAFKNCLIVVLNDVETTSIQKVNNVTVLYHDEEIIGYNIVDERFTDLKDGYHPAAELIEAVNQCLETCGLGTIDADLENRFKVGLVVECEEHPESDHLHICKVDVGSEVLQIVCGAHNVEKGIKVVCACVNAIMPNGQLITAGKLRGIDSYGMLCSEYELGLIEEHKRGLLILDDSYQVGDCFKGGK